MFVSKLKLNRVKNQIHTCENTFSLYGDGDELKHRSFSSKNMLVLVSNVLRDSVKHSILYDQKYMFFIYLHSSSSVIRFLGLLCSDLHVVYAS